jgi:hypothetical protein
LNNNMQARITYGPKQNHILKIELAKEWLFNPTIPYMG